MNTSRNWPAWIARRHRNSQLGMFQHTLHCRRETGRQGRHTRQRWVRNMSGSCRRKSQDRPAHHTRMSFRPGSSQLKHQHTLLNVTKTLATRASCLTFPSLTEVVNCLWTSTILSISRKYEWLGRPCPLRELNPNHQCIAALVTCTSTHGHAHASNVIAIASIAGRNYDRCTAGKCIARSTRFQISDQSVRPL